MTDESNVGLASYSGAHGARRGPRQGFEMLQEKVRLRALLEIETAKIAEALPALNAVEVEQLQGMLAGQAEDYGAEAEVLRQQVEREAALAASTKAMDVRLSREASQVLQAEMMFRLEQRGHCPAPAALVGEAVAKAFAGGRP